MELIPHCSQRSGRRSKESLTLLQCGTDSTLLTKKEKPFKGEFNCQWNQFQGGGEEAGKTPVVEHMSTQVPKSLR